ncbi:ABC transporter substrate-binding protein [Ensifer sp. SSB1]|uniref:ABC transporter substrate-binding protein n=1 Tax=Ensifer sp. SSB1 TaxID=2795385 RepID=UPI001A3A4B3C|nr:ABC transporter substrate-binding protein [Ensifer sp. SSB1]MBK5570408.1 ABC transporter substrate-binding protein [Ensifer sp. SSB1]
MSNNREHDTRSFGRRAVLKGMAGVAALPLLGSVVSAQASQNEATDLANLVKEGKLPPLAERVGPEPLIVQPLEGGGTYGGELRFGLRGSSDHNNILRMVGPQGLVRWNPTYTEIVPNVAKSYDVDETGRVFTFHLRKGMRWSDGHPFGVDDILFNIEDIVLNNEFAPTQPRYIMGGEPMKVEKVDDLTVRFSFKESYGDFLAELASPLGQHPVLYAKHYCSQFHPKYSGNIQQMIKENGASDWQTLFLQKCGDIEIPSRWANPERPTLDAWVVREPYVGAATRVVLVRNPYFWQVDPDGKQLPYIDSVSGAISQDVESLVLSAIGGRIDFGLRHLDPPANRPVLAANREKGDYRFFAATPPGGVDTIFNLNLTHKNTELRELFNKKDFRIALSLGLNRREIIDTVLLGEGEPWQHGPFENHPYFHKRISTQYLDFDPDKANGLLDGIGLDKRGADGMRLLPTGKPLKFKIDVIPTFNPEWVDILQLVEQQWAKIGVDVDINPLERTFFFERTSGSNDHDAAVWTAIQSWVPGQIPQHIVPLHQDSRWGIAWRDWYVSGGSKGEEPPESVKERIKLYDQAKGVVDPERRKELIKKIADIAADEFEVFGLAKAQSTYGIVKNKMKNVPEEISNTWYCAAPSQALPQTWFWGA